MKIVKVLSSEESMKAVSQIDDLQMHWFAHGDLVQFFTLGTAAYIDASGDDNRRYYDRVQAINPILMNSFEWLYRKVLTAISDYTGESCQLSKGQALPGFHIFNAHPAFTMPLASVHIDLQYKDLDWLKEESIRLDQNHVISFTLSLELPSDGAGLHHWSYNEENIPPWSERSNGLEFVKRHPPNYQPYTVGHIAIHSGTMLHQIAPIKRYIAGERRITLQGHGVQKKGGGYLIYW